MNKYEGKNKQIKGKEKKKEKKQKRKNNWSEKKEEKEGKIPQNFTVVLYPGKKNIPIQE